MKIHIDRVLVRVKIRQDMTRDACSSSSVVGKFQTTGFLNKIIGQGIQGKSVLLRKTFSVTMNVK